MHAPRVAEIKVAQAASGVAQKTLYLHGENSLVETIVGLAQDYVGTNNVALLQPLGQFGSRNDKPCTHAAARYIFTKIDPMAAALFPSSDFPVLKLREEEGESIEPEQFFPVLPMLLVNGAQGIGTGFSTCVPSYSVTSLCQCVRAHLAGEELPTLVPHFEGFTGRVDSTERAIVTQGRVEKVEDGVWRILELPIGKWTEPFLTELKALADGSRPSKVLSVQSVTNMSSEFRVNIELLLGEDSNHLEEDDIIRALRLRTSISTTHRATVNSCLDDSIT